MRSCARIILLVGAVLLGVRVEKLEARTVRLQDYGERIAAFQARNEFRRALGEAQALEALVKAKLGTRHLAYAIALAYLGQCSVDLGLYAEAERYYRRGAALAEQLHDSTAVALTGEIATAVRRQGRYAEAEALARRAVALSGTLLPPDDPDTMRVQNGLADILNESGRYAEAEALFRRVLASREKALGPGSKEVGATLTGLANALLGQGRPREAEPIYRRALAIDETTMGPDHADVAIGLTNLANDLEREGRAAEAEPLFRRALAIRERRLGPAHADVGLTLTYLASTLNAQGRAAEAEPLYRRALAVREAALGPNHPDVAQTLNNLGNALATLRRPAEAEPLFRRALANREAALGPDHVEIGQTLGRLGAILQQDGRLDEAEPLLRRALAIDERALGAGNPVVTLALSRLAYLEEVRGRTAPALAWSRRAVASLLARPASEASEDAPDPFSERTDPYRRHLVLLARATRDGIEPADALMREAFETAQRLGDSRAASALNQMTARVSAGGDRLADLIGRRRDLDLTRAGLERRLLAALAKPAAAQDRTAVDEMHRDLTRSEAEIRANDETVRSDFPRYADLAQPRPLAIADAQPLLDRDDALVFLGTGGSDESYVFALTRDAAAWHVIPLGAEAMAAEVAAFRRGLDVNEYVAAQADPAAWFDLGRAHKLHETLLGSVAGLLAGRHSLIVVPTGALTALPFHLLLTQPSPAAQGMEAYRAASWLIRDRSVAILPSVDGLKALRDTPRLPPAPRTMIGFGDPVFDPGRAMASLEPVTLTRAPRATRAAYGDFWRGAGIERAQVAQALPALPETADELRAIAARLGVPDSDLYLGRRASEAAVKAAPLSEYRIVYFATHGLVAGDITSVGEPSLALTQPRVPSPADDGFLTASEASQLRLNADWVVLSACNTIAGDRPGAEALSGLVRGFFYAGARALLVSHWSAASNAATRLTTMSFSLLGAEPGLGRAEAVRRAMLDYLADTADPQNAYPAFWGPFAVIGEGSAR